MTFKRSSNLKIEAEVTKLLNNTTGLAGYCRIRINDCFIINNVQLFHKNDGTIRVQFPPQKDESGEIMVKDTGLWREICHPVTTEARIAINEACNVAYQESKD